jgi:hypothetical protein
MTKELVKLKQKRERLILTIESQRTQLAQSVNAWREPLALLDKGIEWVNHI